MSALTVMALGCMGGLMDDSGSTGGGLGGGIGGFRSPCPDYSGIQDVGTTAAWETTDAYFEDYGQRMSRSSRVESIEGDTVVVSGAGSLESEHYSSYTWTSSSTYVCDDVGMTLVHSVTDVQYVLDGVTSTTNVVTTYTSGLLTIPADLEAGDSWTTNAEGSQAYTDSNGNETDTPFSTSHEYTAHQADDVSTPAGDFDDVLELRTDDSAWFVDADAGTVGSPHEHMTEWSP
jgi:hypothetical protein